MRLAALLLLLANVAFIAWAQYVPEGMSPESHLVFQQINPEAIRLLTPQQVSALGTRKSDQPKLIGCLEWGAFNAGDLARARGLAEPLVAGASMSERRVEEAAGWWVFMPPQGSRQAANQKAAELKRLGVEDFFIVQDDPKFRFAISLGVFRTEEAAKSHLERLRGRGVRTAQLGARTSPVLKVFLQLREVPEAAQAKLAELRQGFPGTDVKECSPEDRRVRSP